MINLLPPEGHRAVKQEYFFRTGASLLLLFSCVGIFLTIALVPTYVLVGAQIKAFDATGKDDTQIDSTLVTESEIQNIEELLKQLSKTRESTAMSEIITVVEGAATPAITFKTFRIESINNATTTIQVQGIAKTRESLARFKGALETTDQFEKAEVPISDLAKETDLPFAITVIPKKNK